MCINRAFICRSEWLNIRQGSRSTGCLGAAVTSHSKHQRHGNEDMWIRSSTVGSKVICWHVCVTHCWEAGVNIWTMSRNADKIDVFLVLEIRIKAGWLGEGRFLLNCFIPQPHPLTMLLSHSMSVLIMWWKRKSKWNLVYMLLCSYSDIINQKLKVYTCGWMKLYNCWRHFYG